MVAILHSREQIKEKLAILQTADNKLMQDQQAVQLQITDYKSRMAVVEQQKVLQSLPQGATVLSPEMTNVHATLHTYLQQIAASPHNQNEQLMHIMGQFQQAISSMPAAPTAAPVADTSMESSPSVSSLLHASPEPEMPAAKIQKTAEQIMIHCDDEADDDKSREVFRQADTLAAAT